MSSTPDTSGTFSLQSIACLVTVLVIGVSSLAFWVRRRVWPWLFEAQPPKFHTSPQRLAERMHRVGEFIKSCPGFDGLLADFQYERVEPGPATLYGSIVPGQPLLRDGQLLDEGAVALLLDSLTGQVNYMAGHEGFVSGEMNIEFLAQALAGEKLMAKAWIDKAPKPVTLERAAKGEREMAMLSFELRRAPKGDGSAEEGELVARGGQMQLCILTPMLRRITTICWYIPALGIYRERSNLKKILEQSSTPVSSLGSMPELLALKEESAPKPGHSCYSAVITQRMLNTGGVGHGAATCALLAAAARQHCGAELRDARVAADLEAEADEAEMLVRRMKIMFLQPVPPSGSVSITVSPVPSRPAQQSPAPMEREVNVVLKGADGAFLARARIAVPPLPEKPPPPQPETLPPAPEPEPVQSMESEEPQKAPLKASVLPRFAGALPGGPGGNRMMMGANMLGRGIGMPRPARGPRGTVKRESSSSEEDRKSDDTDSAEERLERLQRLKAKLDKPSACTILRESRKTQKTEEEHREKAAADVDRAVVNGASLNLDGDWCTPKGEDLATIKGATIHWKGSHSGSTSFLTSLGGKVWSMVLDDETHQVELQPHGHLKWCDGEVWLPKAAVIQEVRTSDEVKKSDDTDPIEEPEEPSQREADDADAAGPVVEAKEEPAMHSKDQLSAGIRAQPLDDGVAANLDGEWNTPEGELIGTIKGDRIHWADSGEDPTVLTSLGGTAWSMELDGETHRGELETGGRLVWSDGEVWLLARSGPL